jgi:hypothetical protein
MGFGKVGRVANETLRENLCRCCGGGGIESGSQEGTGNRPGKYVHPGMYGSWQQLL